MCYINVIKQNLVSLLLGGLATFRGGGVGSLVSGARYFRDLLEATKCGGGVRYYRNFTVCCGASSHWRCFAYRVRDHVGVVL